MVSDKNKTLNIDNYSDWYTAAVCLIFVEMLVYLNYVIENKIIYSSNNCTNYLVYLI